MKEISKKIISILVVMLLVINSSFLTIISTAIDELASSTEKVNIETNVEKFVSYEFNDKKGVLAKINVKAKIEYEEGKEAETTKVELQMPQIKGEYPENIELIENSVKIQNYDYDKQSGKLVVYVNNESKEEFDFSVDMYFGADCYGENLEYNGTTIEEQISGLISTSITTNDIYNGYIKSNAQNGTKYKTEYTENLEIKFDYKEISDEIEIKETDEVKAEDIIYKSISLNKNNILDILGENGTLKIQNESGEDLLEINKDTASEEDGTIKFDYNKDVKGLTIKTSKPEKVGTIKIENKKAINETMVDLSATTIKTETKINCINNVEVEPTETEETENTEEIETEQEIVYNFSDNKETEIKGTETKVDLSMDKKALIANSLNQVNFTATLVSNDAKYSLFKNPVIEIKLPAEVEKVTLGNIFVLYDNAFSVIDQVVTEEGDCKVIRITLSGTQNSYVSSNVYAGPEVLIPATLTVNKDVASNQNAVVSVKCTNNNVIAEYSSQDYNVAINSIQVISLDEETESDADNSEEQPEVVEDYSGLTSSITATIGDKALTEGESVYEYEYIKYNVTLKNTSKTKMQNINVVGSVPVGTVFVNTYFDESKAIDNYIIENDYEKTEFSEIVSLNAGEEKQLSYTVKVLELGKDEAGASLTEKNIQSNIKVSARNNVINEYTLNNVVKKAEMELKLESWETRRKDNLWVYKITATNKTENNISNVTIDMGLQKEMKFSDIDSENDGYSVNETVDGLRVNVSELKANEEKEIYLFIKKTRIDEKILDFETETFASAKGDDTKTYYSNINKARVYTAGIEVTQTSTKEGKELEKDEEIEYNFVIKNISNENILQDILSLQFMNFTDENLIPVSADYEYWDYEYDESNDIYKDVKGKSTVEISKKVVEEGVDPSTVPDLSIILSIPKGKEVNVTLKLKAGEVKEKTEVSNSLKVAYEYCGEHVVTSNVIKNTILPVENPDDGSDDEPDDDIFKYSIGGFVWKDSNKNGKFDDDEEKLSGITVKLFNAETNSIVKDENGNNLYATTDNEGKYIFEDVSIGKYLVLFEYDVDNYSVTTYKKELVSDDVNSDVVVKEVSIDGVEKTVAVTDILELENADKLYVNMGLVEKEKFDLSLDKSITKVTVKYDGFYKEYDYKETKLAKVDIPAKKMQGAQIQVDYQIKVTNEGNVKGYVNEIADYLPDGFEFDNGLNNDWKYENGILKNTSNSGITLDVGQSKVFTLHLTKTLDENSTGKYENSAEILNSNSVNGTTDIDSTNGNKVTTEDDYSKAELLISIKTGAVAYIGIILLLIGILIVLKVLMDKKIINIKRLKIFSVIFVLMFIMFCGKSVKAIDVVSGINDATIESQADITKKIINYLENNYKVTGGKSIKLYMEKYDAISERKLNNIVSHIANREGISEDEAIKYYLWARDRGGYIHYDSNGNKIVDKDGNEIVTSSSNLGKRHKVDGSDSECVGNCRLAHGYLNVKVAYGYVHHEVTPEPYGKLFCSDGLNMAIGEDNAWTYNYQGVEIKINGDIDEIESKREGVATITGIYNKVQYIDKSDYYLVGPYTINYEGEISSVKVYSSGNTEISSKDYEFANERGQSIKIDDYKNSPIYLKIKNKKYKSISGINILVKNTAKFTFEVGYTSTEIWEDIGKHYKAQEIHRKKIISKEEVTINVGTTNEINLPGASIDKVTLRIRKVDATNKSKVLKGAKFKLEDSKGNIVFKDKETNNAGEIEYDLLPGTYKITETHAPQDYIIDTETKTIKVEEGENNTFEFTNTPKKTGKLKLIIEKIDGNTKEPLKKAVFRILDSKNKAINGGEEYTTGPDGTVTITEGLEAGKTYYIEEVSAPPGGYKLKTESTKVVIPEDATTKTVTIKNYKEEDTLPLEVKVKKVDSRNKEPMQGVQFTFSTEIQKLVKSGTHSKPISGYWTNGKTGKKAKYSSTKTKECTIFKKSTKDTAPEDAKKYVKDNANYEDYDLYKYQTVTYYLDSNGKWVENQQKHTTASNGIIKISNISEPKQKLEGKVYYKDTKGNSHYLDNGGTVKLSYVKKDKDGNPIINATETGITNEKKYYYGYEIQYGTSQVKQVSLGQTTTILNKQICVKLSGTVWLDGGEGNKQTLRDNLYDSNKEEGISGINVRVVDIRTSSTATDKNGNYLQTTTDSKGKYTFENVLLEALEAGYYYIEFEYHGMKYQAVDVGDLKESNTSKAAEDGSRNNLNDKFENGVTGTGGNSLSIGDASKGYVVVNYSDTANYKSTVVSYEGDNVRANTSLANYYLNRNWEATQAEITNINLGLYERPQIDLALGQDLEEITVKSNGKEHIYTYGKRTYSTKSDGSEYKKIKQTYIRELYKADAEYGEKNEEQFEILLTYKISLLNQSGNDYTVKVNNLLNYYNNEYEIVEIGENWNKDNNTISNPIERSPNVEKDNGYKKIIININTTMGPDGSKDFYIQYKINAANTLSLLNSGNIDLYPVAEINSYTTTYSNGGVESPVAAVDVDSVPGNAKPGNISSYEDDTEAAPIVQLKETDSVRTLNGTVFLDWTTGELKTGGIRKADGIYDERIDIPLKGIEVELFDVQKNDIGYIYSKEEGLHQAKTTTDEQGNYEFAGLVAGEYEVRFIWGDSKYKVQYYKGTIYDSNRDTTDEYWYKNDNTRRTDAMDNYNLRKEIDKQAANINDRSLEVKINEAYDKKNNDIITKMTSITPKMKFGIEFNDTEGIDISSDGAQSQFITTAYKIENIDFGIVERARQQMDISKRVKYFKITLSNGQVLAEANIDANGKVNGELNYVTYQPSSINNGIKSNGFIKAEVDKEIIENANLLIKYEIVVTNNSEKDYYTQDYYVYGTIPEREDKVITLKPSTIIEYSDSEMILNNNNSWNLTNTTEIRNLNAHYATDSEFLKGRTLYANTGMGAFKPTESQTIEIEASKLLTSTDDYTFDNDVEIATIDKPNVDDQRGSVAKFSINGVPVAVDAAEKAIIIPPTGDNESYTQIVIISVISLAILSTGIVLIKKFVIG